MYQKFLTSMTHDLLTAKRHPFNFDTNALTWYLIICQKRNKESKLVPALAQYGSVLRINWRLLTILKTSSKYVWSIIFWYEKVHIFSKYIQYTIHWGKMENFEKFSSNKISSKKMPSFIFFEFKLITVLLLVCNSYMNWSTRFVSLKQYLGFSVFDSLSFLLNFIFLFKKLHGLFGFKTSSFLSKLK